jgi:hypothetical protein
MTGIRESWRKATKEEEEKRRRIIPNRNSKEAQVLEGQDNRLHDLVLGNDVRGLSSLHHLARCAAIIQILDKSNSERTAAILVASELG